MVGKSFIIKGILLLQCIAYTYYYIHGYHGYKAQQEIHITSEQLAQTIDAAIQDINLVTQRIELLNTDPFYKEKIAREELHMANSGDIIYYIPKKH